MAKARIGSSFDDFLEEEGIKDEVDRRVQNALSTSDGSSLEPALYWLSFVQGESFVGACIVEAVDDASALTRADALGIHPGGEVAIMRMEPDASEPGAMETARDNLDRLFRTRAEIEALFGRLKNAAEAIAAGDQVEFACEKHSRPT